MTVKFTDSNRYGLIGANGCGKSTLMKILGSDLEQSAGDVMLQPGLRLGKLSQNQFGYEDQRVIDVVMQGHAEMWAAMSARDAIYADLAATDDDYMRAAELEVQFAEYGGYDAEARAASILIEAGITAEFHHGPMREVPPGLKLRVLLAQALFSDPDVLLLDEPTNNLDIHSIGWLEQVLNKSDSTMIIISHDRHFLNQVCTHIADLDFQQLRVYPGNYDDFMLASTQARARVEASNTKAQERIAGVLKPTAGSINWVENAEPGYMPQDPQAEFEEKTDLLKWMQQWSGKADDEQIVRATLGRLLFSGDETKKSVKVLSGGEKGRMMYGKLMLTRPNVLLLDEPTNHMDMETIESLQIGLEKYPGTLLFVSHDREFVSGLATRIIEIQPGGGIVDVHGDYDEYLKSQGLSV